MAIRTYYRVMGEGLGRKDFAEAAEALGLAQVNRWQKGSDKDYEEGWANPERTRALSYLEDRFTGLPYVAITAADVDKLLLELDGELDLYTPEELIDTAYRADRPEEQVTTLNRLEITFPEFDETVFQIYAGFLMTSPTAAVRYAALDAIARHPWSAFRSLIDKIARDDPDPEARVRAEEIRTYWDEAVDR